jgi:predicted phage replisome organizer
MAENKKYYWLKLKSDFFDDDTIKYIEEQENGIKYSNFYLKLCLKSLKTDGKLIRLIGETLIPYDINSLSKLTGVDFDTVRSAMQLFEKIGLIKILDSGEIYLSQIDELIGSETDKAQLMRRLRAERKLNSNNVTKMLPYIEKEIEIEKDIEIDIKEKKKRKFQPPTLEEIKQYILEKELKVNAEQFYNYFTEGNWIDAKGNKVKNWKQKLLTWNKYQVDVKEEKKTNYNNYDQRQYDNMEKFYANKL